MMNRACSIMTNRAAAFLVASFICLTGALLAAPAPVAAATAANKMVAIGVDTDNGQIVVNVETANPVGYRYTVYDSIDPTRVVVDFPGMDVNDVTAPTVSDGAPVREVKVSSFDLTSGKLARLEVILDSTTSYDVALKDNLFKMTFSASAADSAITAEAAPASEAVPETESENAAVVEPEKAEIPKPAAQVQTSVAAPVVSGADADTITGVSIQDSSLSFNADGHLGIFKYFTLGAPPRLVVDVYGVKAGFKEKKFALANGFDQLRVGSYSDKIRFVFDAKNGLPEYSVTGGENAVAVAWGDAVGTDVPVQPAPAKASGVPVNVEAVDFDIEGNQSVVRVTLSGATPVIKPTVKDGIVGFGVQNATISRALRRAIDASSFPSSIRLITPYTVLVGKSQDVRFAVELKGPSDYELDTEGNVVTLKVVNGPFAEPEAPAGEKKAVEVADTGMQQPKQPMDGDMTEPMVVVESAEATTSGEEVVSAVDETELSEIEKAVEAEMSGLEPESVRQRDRGYSGQRISLVFDNADIRNILQLIAEVSNLNILAGDGVDGTITLRLIDVPWDQALDLILETKDLGMLRDGNVARILPKESIRAMDEAKFTAERTKEKLEDLEKAVITVSYTDLKNVSGPAKKFLTDRGSITEDARNKKLIIKDIPKVIEEIRDLVSELDTPEKQVLIEARIVEVDVDTSFELGINWNILYNQDGTTPFASNQTSQVGFGGDFLIVPGSAGTGNQPGLGTTFSFGRLGVDTTVLDLRLSALETAGNGRVVSNPRIMTLNGEEAKISQGTMIPYQSSDGDTVKTELVEAALSLKVTPIVNPDNSVIIDVEATNDTPGAELGGLTSIDKKAAETKMLVKDGETMVIGGVYVEQEEYSERGVPMLMNIPFIGQLFRSTRTSTNRAELMVFITPRIID